MNLLYPDANKKMNIPTNPPFENLIHRVVLFEFHLKFWNTDSIGIPARSLL